MPKCKSCGLKLPKDANYCHQCGSKVSGRGGKFLGMLATLTATAVLALQLYAVFAGMGNRTTATLMEVGYPYYVDNGVTYVVVGPDPGTVEAVARLAGKGQARFGYSTCHAPVKGYMSPISLDSRTVVTNTRLASAVEEVWLAGMGKASWVGVLYNGTHAVITLAIPQANLPSILAALSAARQDVCVRVVIG
jgi:hypothetical protein